MLMITRSPGTHYWDFLTIYPFLWINLFANIITLFSIKFLKKLEHLDLSEDLLDGYLIDLSLGEHTSMVCTVSIYVLVFLDLCFFKTILY